MNVGTTDAAEGEIALAFELDEPPGKVWRAISVAELRAVWLPGPSWAEAEVVGMTPGREIHYRLRDDDPPFLDSTVLFSIAPSETGGTILRIVHERVAPLPHRTSAAFANDNPSCLTLAA